MIASGALEFLAPVGGVAPANNADGVPVVAAHRCAAYDKYPYAEVFEAWKENVPVADAEVAPGASVGAVGNAVSVVSFDGFVAVVAVLVVVVAVVAAVVAAAAAAAAGCYGHCVAVGRLHDAAFEVVEYFQVAHTGPWPLAAFLFPSQQSLPLRLSTRVERSLLMHYPMITLLDQHHCPVKLPLLLGREGPRFLVC